MDGMECGGLEWNVHGYSRAEGRNGKTDPMMEAILSLITDPLMSRRVRLEREPM